MVKCYLRPADLDIPGFNGTKWDTLDTQVDNNPTQDQWNTYTFTNTTAYQAYRIFISNTNDGGWAMITELKLLPTPVFNSCSNKLFVASATIALPIFSG